MLEVTIFSLFFFLRQFSPICCLETIITTYLRETEEVVTAQGRGAAGYSLITWGLLWEGLRYQLDLGLGKRGWVQLRVFFLLFQLQRRMAELLLHGRGEFATVRAHSCLVSHATGEPLLVRAAIVPGPDWQPA